MLGEYIMLGFSIAVTVAAMLIGFVALITAINGVFDSIFGITFQSILGYIFSPLAFVMGIPTSEMLTAGQIMATKLVTNEFVAMLDLGKVAGDLSARTVGILSIFLVSFANFSSIGIIAGATKSIDGKQANVVSSFGFKTCIRCNVSKYIISGYRWGYALINSKEVVYLSPRGMNGFYFGMINKKRGN